MTIATPDTQGEHELGIALLLCRTRFAGFAKIITELFRHLPNGLDPAELTRLPIDRPIGAMPNTVEVGTLDSHNFWFRRCRRMLHHHGIREYRLEVPENTVSLESAEDPFRLSFRDTADSNEPYSLVFDLRATRTSPSSASSSSVQCNGRVGASMLMAFTGSEAAINGPRCFHVKTGLIFISHWRIPQFLKENGEQAKPCEA